VAYQYTTTETEAEHAERIGVDETSEETRWCDTCSVWEAAELVCEKAVAAALAAEEAAILANRPPPARIVARMRRQTLICSCGHRTCRMINRYGLTVPTFRGDIEPIPSQYARDRRALEIKAGGGL
jgi:hypothetical protein